MDRTIRVTGKGEIFVKPDIIRLNIHAAGTYKEYSLSLRKSAEHTNLLRETISKAGFDPQNLKTDYFDINTDYEDYTDQHGEHRSRFIGYKYTHNLYIQLPNDNEQLGKVLYQLANNAVNVDLSLSYEVKDANAVKNELLDKAIEDSKIKAEVLAKAAGVSLGEIKEIDYSWGELEIYSQPVHGIKLGKKMMPAEGYNFDIVPGDIDVQDTVTIIWEIK